MTSTVHPCCANCRAFRPTCVDAAGRPLAGNCHAAPVWKAVAGINVTAYVEPNDFCRLFDPRPAP